MYRIKWWDAYGNSHISEPMNKLTADTFAANMNADQEPTLMLVYINI